MRVLILTDSVSLPRKHSGGEVQWDDIYFRRLQRRFPNTEFILVGIGGATITQLLAALNYYSLVKPAAVILQSGIVDCAPRALTQFEQQLVIKLHLFRFIHPLTKFLRKRRSIAYTNAKDFENTLLNIKNRFPGVPLIGIGILPGCDAYEAKVPGINKRIEQYNAIIQKHTQYIDNSNMNRDGIIDDFHHMNEIGHEEIFNKLVPALQQALNNKL